ncbi:unnamed protein product [Acanthoscelides obtectus]|uniref:Uncharacterized protein n=1 Tax=Acanthoscelides obtectus TaxID=200917 RepID=A0A9P0K3L3_ACAOB|nr:unnamed protein product [Acanthoscelides obtectus]CAK1652345.1 hypothetical protein AOBTE_LOCUS17798 [Acanthoscelides obtectus]
MSTFYSTFSEYHLMPGKSGRSCSPAPTSFALTL